METIADRLKLLRVTLLGGGQEISERELSRQLTDAGFPVSNVSVGSYEKRGASGKIPADYLRSICVVFNISPAWLLLGEETPWALPERPLEKEFGELHALLRSATDRVEAMLALGAANLAMRAETGLPAESPDSDEATGDGHGA